MFSTTQNTAPIAASLQKANALPSQIHARREHIRQQIQDQRKRAKVITHTYRLTL